MKNFLKAVGTLIVIVAVGAVIVFVAQHTPGHEPLISHTGR